MTIFLTSLATLAWCFFIIIFASTPIEWKVGDKVVNDSRTVSVIVGPLVVLLLATIGYLVGGFLLLPFKALLF